MTRFRPVTQMDRVYSELAARGQTTARVIADDLGVPTKRVSTCLGRLATTGHAIRMGVASTDERSAGRPAFLWRLA